MLCLPQGQGLAELHSAQPEPERLLHQDSPGRQEAGQGELLEPGKVTFQINSVWLIFETNITDICLLIPFSHSK